MCDDMYEKIKEFVIKHRYIVISIFIFVIVFAAFVLCQRKNVSINGVSINDIRTELSNAQDTKSDIADTKSDIAEDTKSDIADTKSDIAETVGNLASSINTATGASQHFDTIIDECTGIIEQIRKQPAGK